MRRARATIAAAWLWAVPGAALAQSAAPDSPPEETPPPNAVVLQGLNKVTGRISKLEGPLGALLRFDNLEILPRRCWKSPPEERPESAALLEIQELQPGERAKRVFLGWMLASSPGLSGLEHPVYDITVLACEYRADPEKNDAPAEPEAKEEASSKKSVKKDARKKKSDQ